MLAIVGFQSLIHLGNLINPSADQISQFGLGPNQQNWGNVGVARDLLALDA